VASITQLTMNDE